MSETKRVECRNVKVLGQAAEVHVGGEGTQGIPLLLVHGGWGGARMHWSGIWDRLAERHLVVAPELPGLGNLEVPPLSSVGAYAEWLVALLDVLRVPRAFCIGNSFGGSVAWSFAGRAPERCEGVILVNGIPMPKTPPPLRWLGRTRPGAGMMRALLKRLSYTPAALPRAFVNPAHAPEELREMLGSPRPVLLGRFAELVMAGDGPPPPRVPPLLLWGEGDKLMGTGAKTARKLVSSFPGAKLALLPRAGHFPQLEAPEAFVSALNGFVEASVSNSSTRGHPLSPPRNSV